MRHLAERAASLLWRRIDLAADHTPATCQALRGVSQSRANDPAHAANAFAIQSAQHSQRLGGHCIPSLRSISTAVTAQQHAQHDSDDRAVSLAFPTFVVWGANTDVGKTLVSAGLAAAAARSKASCHLSCCCISICISPNDELECTEQHNVPSLLNQMLGGFQPLHLQVTCSECSERPAPPHRPVAGEAAVSEARSDRLPGRLGRAAGGELCTGLIMSHCSLHHNLLTHALAYKRAQCHDSALDPAQGAVIGAPEECGPHAAALRQGRGGSSGFSSDADTDVEGRGQPQAESQLPAAPTAQTLFAWSAPASPHLTVQREGAAP